MIMLREHGEAKSQSDIGITPFTHWGRYILSRDWCAWHSRNVEACHSSHKPAPNWMVELLTRVNTGGSDSIDDVLHSRCLPWEDGGLTSTIDYGVALVLN